MPCCSTRLGGSAAAPARALRKFVATAIAATTLCACPASGQSGLTGTITIGVEAERKTCTTCATAEHDNKLETTPLELVVRSPKRRDISFGLELEHDVDSEGNFFGSGQTDTEVMNAIRLWVRRDFSAVFWGRVQAKYRSDEDAIDLGGRIGLQRDLGDNSEISAYLNLDRRISLGSRKATKEGTYVEARAMLEWDWDDYGAWVELKTDHWFYGAAANEETRATVQPGLWFKLGDTPHKGLVWIEGERRTREGASDFKRDTRLAGLGVELDLGKRRDLLLGVVGGTERQTETGKAEKRSRVQGLVVEFKLRF